MSVRFALVVAALGLSAASVDGQARSGRFDQLYDGWMSASIGSSEEALAGADLSDYVRTTVGDDAIAAYREYLGAPVGSVLAGSRDWIGRARRARRRLGGDMRQVVVLAACGLYALEHHVVRLGADHARARDLASGCAGLPGLRVDPESVETNIVLVDLEPGPWDAARWMTEAAQRGVGIIPFGPRRLRFVTVFLLEVE